MAKKPSRKFIPPSTGTAPLPPVQEPPPEQRKLPEALQLAQTVSRPFTEAPGIAAGLLQQGATIVGGVLNRLAPRVGKLLQDGEPTSPGLGPIGGLIPQPPTNIKTGQSVTVQYGPFGVQVWGKPPPVSQGKFKLANQTDKLPGGRLAPPAPTPLKPRKEEDLFPPGGKPKAGGIPAKLNPPKMPLYETAGYGGGRGYYGRGGGYGYSGGGRGSGSNIVNWRIGY